MIRHGAGARCTRSPARRVPRLTVILRKAYGGAYITMNSKDLGADLTFAWPGAEIGVMGAAPAVGIIHRRDLAAAADPARVRERLAGAYAAQHLTRRAPQRASGYVDEVVEPAETRRAPDAGRSRAGNARAKGASHESGDRHRDRHRPCRVAASSAIGACARGALARGATVLRRSPDRRRHGVLGAHHDRIRRRLLRRR